MRAASWPRQDPLETRLLEVGRGGAIEHALRDLPVLLCRGDVLVVNDAATLPASLAGRTARGEPIELRLAGPPDVEGWRAVLFGAGDWHARTEDRPPPPPLAAGDRLTFEGLGAIVRSVDPAAPRLVRVAFDLDGDELYRALYRVGTAVQYAYVAAPLPLWHVQTAYAARPWAVEAPSAGLALTWELLLSARSRGVRLARVTHAAGLSSTGDATLDARLPFDERYAIPDETVQLIEAAQHNGRRVVAVGTTVTRALEGATAAHGRLVAGEGVTGLRLHAEHRPRVVDAILTGIHDPSDSHFRLLEAFAPRAELERAHARSTALGHRVHEFGDAWLVWGSRESRVEGQG
jgi:S-adenosylmethionine:tRNA ribosyltransferase-isomerase